MDIGEAVRQFERYRESGWSKSEVPSSGCLMLALGALRENERLKQLADVLGDEVLGANADLAKSNTALRTEVERLKNNQREDMELMEESLEASKVGIAAINNLQAKLEQYRDKLQAAETVVELARKGMGLLPIAWIREFNTVIKAYDGTITPYEEVSGE